MTKDQIFKKAVFSMRSLLKPVRNLEANHYAHAIVGLVMFATALSGVSETILDDLKTLNFHSGHGVGLFGLWYSVLALGRLFNDLLGADSIIKSGGAAVRRDTADKSGDSE